MKFLLVAVNAKYIHSNLAVYSLKAYAEKYSVSDNNIEIAEYTINQYADEILRDIYERRPDAVGFSCYIWNIEMIKKIAADYKKICPYVTIWVGGPEVSYNVQQVLEENSFFDCVMYGEGEEIFKNVIQAYKKEDEHYNVMGCCVKGDKHDNVMESCTKSDISYNILEKIKGIGFKQEGKVVVTEPQPPISLSSIPFVYENMEQFENKIIYYETSRGCPFSCSYCLSSIDKTMRFRDMELVKSELKFFIEHNTAQVKFVDRTFNCRHDMTMEIWKFIKENDNGITNFHFEIAADLITDDEIELIRTMRQGLIQLEIGVQSVNDMTLGAIHRKTNLYKIEKAVKKIREGENIHQHLDLIAGLPYEGYESFAESFNRVYAMKPDQLQLGFLKVLHGSLMETESDKYRITYSGSAPYEVLETKWISFEQLLKLKEVTEAVEIYYNSFQFVNTIKMLESEFQSAFDLYEKLGFYYKNHSANGEKHSRISRYNILIGFMEETVSGFQKKSNKYKEALTLDFYLRENAKSRPHFSNDDSMHKKEIREFFKSDKVREILPGYENYDSRQLEKMTHVEEFGIDSEKKTYILFDYKNRNVLNRQAATVDITKWINT